MSGSTRHQCRCCGYHTLQQRGCFEVCPVCYWKDDDPAEVFGQPAPERPHGPNVFHLWQARLNFQAFGASEETFRHDVRPPREDERLHPTSLPIAVDPEAISDDWRLPAFIVRPSEALVYHGFPILDDVEADGFRLGVITDFEAEESTWGDAFVVAPDGSRAGIIWITERDTHYRPDAFDKVSPLGRDRWGVWQVAFPYLMRTREDARRNLRAIVPKLRIVWEQWREEF